MSDIIPGCRERKNFKVARTSIMQLRVDARLGRHACNCHVIKKFHFWKIMRYISLFRTVTYVEILHTILYYKSLSPYKK
jgi:hypothetical protein